MDIVCKILPEHVVREVEETHYDGLYAWVPAEGEKDRMADVLNVRFANSNYVIYLDDYPFETLEHAQAEATRLNLRNGIDDNLMVLIMRSSEWIEPRDLGDEICTDEERRARMQHDSPEDDNLGDEGDGVFNRDLIDPF